MQNSVGFTESGQHYSRTAATDCHFRKTKRAEAKRQRNLDTIQMLVETAFLLGMGYVGILLLGTAMAVLGG